MSEHSPAPIAIYGHPFSSYTWKVLIALYANETAFDFRILDDEHPEHQAFIQGGGPLGKFPVLADGDNLIFETTTIIEYLDRHHSGPQQLIPTDIDAAIGVRMLDRVFDNYVMGPMQEVVDEYLRDAAAPDVVRVGEARVKLRRAYAWLEGWLRYYALVDTVSLIECAAAPSLFYADWVAPIGNDFPRLARWRAHLLAMPAVARCVDDARPYRAGFPLGAPDRD